MTRGIWIMLILCVVSERSIHAELTGSHICQDEQRYKVNVTKHGFRNVTVRRYEWCVQVPPRCSVYTVQRINFTKIEEEDRIRYVDRCCEGYYESDGRCSPNSCRSCKHGACGDDGDCHCNRGYWGDSCDKECTDPNQSQHCQNECNNCVQGYCDITTGNCTCSPKSIRCDLDCSESRECIRRCKCNNTSAACDPLTRKCVRANESNEDYASGYDDYDNIANAKFVQTNLESSSNRGKDNLDVTTPSVTKSSRESTESDDINYLTSKSAEDELMKVTSSITTTEKNEKDRDYTIRTREEISSTKSLSYNPSKPSIEIHANKEFSQLETITNSRRISDVNDERSENKQKEISAMQSSNESSQKVVIDSRLFITIISGALFIVLIIMSAAVFCMLYKLKAKKKKIVNTMNDNEEAKIRDSISSVSVTTRSIFHTPLPDPPVFENPTFLTQFEGAQGKQSGMFEAHVICNMNIPAITTNNQTKPVEIPEIFYDHPPSTGSYRPASIPEPPNPDCVKATFDPIYDEIPCNQKRVAVSTPPPSYASSEQAILYMNTK